MIETRSRAQAANGRAQEAIVYQARPSLPARAVPRSRLLDDHTDRPDRPNPVVTLTKVSFPFKTDYLLYGTHLLCLQTRLESPYSTALVSSDPSRSIRSSQAHSATDVDPGVDLARSKLCTNYFPVLESKI